MDRLADTSPYLLALWHHREVFIYSQWSLPRGEATFREDRREPDLLDWPVSGHCGDKEMRKVAIAIAVEKYADLRIHSVDYAAADATEFARVLEQHGFAAADQLILIDGQATKTVIQSKLGKLIAGLAPDDILYVYFAGHGFALNNRNFITCHDTQVDDLSGTSVAVEWLFGQFRSSPCLKITLFLDSCEAGLFATSEVRGIYTDLTEDELKKFFAEAEHRICFAACKPGQESRSHGSLKHGVWTHHLIQAFNGDAPLALEKETFLTSTSLQNFLNVEVPRSVRTLFTGTETQTPWFYGAASGDFLIADIGPILAKRKVAADPTRKQLKYVRLLNDEKLPVRRLSGFSKGHFVPDRVTVATESFVSKIAEKDVEAEIEQVNQRLKDAFKFKRRDIAASVNGGSGSIVTPFFDYEVTVTLNPDAPSEALFRRQIINIREPDQVFCDDFDDVFKGKFDRLEFGTGQPLNLEKIIDQIEGLDSDDIEVRYDKDLTRCSIHVAGSKIQIEVTQDNFCITQSGRQSPKALIQSFFDTQKLLIDNHKLEYLPFHPSED